MVVLTTQLDAKPGCEGDVRKALAELAARVRQAEEGCLAYQPMESRHLATRFLIFERYRDDTALTHHSNAPHFQEALLELMGLLESPPELALYDEVGDSSS